MEGGVEERLLREFVGATGRALRLEPRPAMRIDAVETLEVRAFGELRARTNVRHQLHTLRRTWPVAERFLEVTTRTLQSCQRRARGADLLASAGEARPCGTLIFPMSGNAMGLDGLWRRNAAACVLDARRVEPPRHFYRAA